MSSSPAVVPEAPDPAEKPQHRPGSYLTKAQFHRLSWACRPVRKAFDCSPYLVGSVLHRPDYRDVDLRVPMAYERGGTDFTADGERLLFLNCAISDWLSAMTQLPIDFQFQTLDEWAEYDGSLRNPMGVV